MKGEHMVPVLNELGIDVACYGNHGLFSLCDLMMNTPVFANIQCLLEDFDFGEARLAELSRESNFPWVLSNCVHTTDPPGRLLACAENYKIKKMGPYRVGFFGLAGT